MKGLFKKIIGLVLVLSLIIPFVPKAYAINLEDYTSTTLEEALQEEGIEYNFKHTSSSKHVQIYLFRGSGCGYCHRFLEYAANTLMKDYNDKVDIVPFEVWNNAKNAELFQGVAEMLETSADGVPFFVIGDQYFTGYSEEMNASITSAIDTEYAKSDRYDVLQKYVEYLENKEKEEKKANQIDFSSVIIWNFVFIAVSTIIVLAFINKKYHDLNGDNDTYSSEYDDYSKEKNNNNNYNYNNKNRYHKKPNKNNK